MLPPEACSASRNASVRRQRLANCFSTSRRHIAHFESRLVSERTRDGIAAARKRGRKPGHPPLNWKPISAAQTLIETGLTPGQTAKQLGIGRATVYKIAKVPR